MNLFVGNLSPDVDDRVFHDAFTPYGKVMSAKVMLDIITGRHRGFGFVYFEREDDALNALRHLNGSPLGVRGHRINVVKADSTGESAIVRTPKIYSRNIPTSVTIEELKEKFGAYGNIKNICFRPASYSPSAPPATANAESASARVLYVEFATADEALLAVERTHNTRPWPHMPVPMLSKVAETAHFGRERRNRLAAAQGGKPGGSGGSTGPLSSPEASSFNSSLSETTSPPFGGAVRLSTLSPPTATVYQQVTTGGGTTYAPVAALPRVHAAAEGAPGTVSSLGGDGGGGTQPPRYPSHDRSHPLTPGVSPHMPHVAGPGSSAGSSNENLPTLLHTHHPHHHVFTLHPPTSVAAGGVGSGSDLVAMMPGGGRPPLGDRPLSRGSSPGSHASAAAILGSTGFTGFGFDEEETRLDASAHFASSEDHLPTLVPGNPMQPRRRDSNAAAPNAATVDRDHPVFKWNAETVGPSNHPGGSASLPIPPGGQRFDGASSNSDTSHAGPSAERGEPHPPAASGHSFQAFAMEPSPPAASSSAYAIVRRDGPPPDHSHGPSSYAIPSTAPPPPQYVAAAPSWPPVPVQQPQPQQPQQQAYHHSGHLAAAPPQPSYFAQPYGQQPPLPAPYPPQGIARPPSQSTFSYAHPPAGPTYHLVQYPPGAFPAAQPHHQQQHPPPQPQPQQPQHGAANTGAAPTYYHMPPPGHQPIYHSNQQPVYAPPPHAHAYHQHPSLYPVPVQLQPPPQPSYPMYAPPPPQPYSGQAPVHSAPGGAMYLVYVPPGGAPPQEGRPCYLAAAPPHQFAPPPPSSAAGSQPAS